MVKMRDVWDNTDNKAINMTAIGAKEALRRDPERYSLKPRAKAVEPEPDIETGDDGDGEFDEPERRTPKTAAAKGRRHT